MPFPPVLTAEAMRAADRYTMETFGVPSFALMESAARGAAERVRAAYGPMAGQRVVVLCGTGHNGGDGLAMARTLFDDGARVHVVLAADPDALAGDPARNWRLLRHLAREAPGGDRLTLAPFDGMDAFAGAVSALRPTLYLDALLGTGLTSALRPPVDALVAWLNAHGAAGGGDGGDRAPVVAVDVPTGLHADTGAVLGDATVADRTVTMAAPKTGLLVGEGPRCAGTVETVEIGIPRFVIERVAAAHAGCARWITTAGVRDLLPTRAHDAHKYSVGMALVVAGAPGFTGAPVMASEAAARAGAGYVTCACPASVQAALAVKLTDVPTVALPVTNEDGGDGEDGSEDGGEDGGGLDADAALAALAGGPLAKAKALLVGPGLGRAAGTQALVRRLLRRADVPAVIDADGLNALAGHLDGDLAAHAAGRWILTPHAGELRRLTGPDADLSDRIRTALACAAQWNSIVVYKGMPSVVGTPDGRAFVSRAGGPALATAGTGDVLAGLGAGFLAQGLAPADAACCALHLGGLAADHAATATHPHAVTATDVLRALPAAWRTLAAA
jgi:NAD(P)H-hydrate epimerase